MAAIQHPASPQAARCRDGHAGAPVQIVLALSALSTLFFGGCVVSGPDPDAMVDTSLITGSIAPAGEPTAAAAGGAGSIAPSEQISDQRTVRNAVSAADIADSDGRFAWANPQTGASGVITALQEVRQGSVICRSFQTSRQRFDGIALFRGEACTDGEGEWSLVRFAENGQ